MALISKSKNTDENTSQKEQFSLLTYEEVINELSHDRPHLLLGNGFSIACDRVFSYNHLYDYAKENGLSKKVLKVFDKLGTNNFEAVMRLLDDADWLCEHYSLVARSGKYQKPFREELKSVKQALVNAIAMTHPKHTGEIDEKKKSQCANFLETYHNIFTTNYDLLLYWVEMLEPSKLGGRDGFRNDPDDKDANYVVFSEHLGSNKGIFFLHGGLHLYVVDGQVRKHTWSRTQKPLIKSIGDGLEQGQYPLFVAEGGYQKKLEQIQTSGYLSYCLGKLGRIQNQLVVYGLSFGDSDTHIANAIADSRKLKILYVSLYGDPDSPDNKQVKTNVERICERRKRNNEGQSKFELSVKYYDAESAPVWGEVAHKS